MATYTSTIYINASAQQVFDTLTKPALVKLWQFEKEVITDWQVGSEIKFKVKHGDTILEQWGTILEMQPNECIKYNLFTPKPDIEDIEKNYTVTSYVLTTSNDQTQVELIQEDNRSNGFAPTTLNPILALLKKVVETN